MADKEIGSGINGGMREVNGEIRHFLHFRTGPHLKQTLSARES